MLKMKHDNNNKYHLLFQDLTTLNCGQFDWTVVKTPTPLKKPSRHFMAVATNLGAAENPEYSRSSLRPHSTRHHSLDGVSAHRRSRVHGRWMVVRDAARTAEVFEWNVARRNKARLVFLYHHLGILEPQQRHNCVKKVLHKQSSKYKQLLLLQTLLTRAKVTENCESEMWLFSRQVKSWH